MVLLGRAKAAGTVVHARLPVECPASSLGCRCPACYRWFLQAGRPGPNSCSEAPSSRWAAQKQQLLPLEEEVANYLKAGIGRIPGFVHMTEIYLCMKHWEPLFCPKQSHASAWSRIDNSQGSNELKPSRPPQGHRMPRATSSLGGQEVQSIPSGLDKYFYNFKMFLTFVNDNDFRYFLF